MSELKKAILAGAKGRCPYCYEGKLFDGYLKFAKNCENCGNSFEIEDAGDGPAVFVIFVASAIVVPLALAFQALLDPPIWLLLIIWLPIITLVCLALLRPFRGMMFAVQIANKAEEYKWDNTDQEDND